MGYPNGSGGAAMGSGSLEQYTTVAQAPPRGMPMVAIQLDRQAKGTEHLHSLLSDLEARLSGIVRAVPPSVADQGGKNSMELVPLAGGLAEQNNRIESACHRVMSLLERIEL